MLKIMVTLLDVDKAEGENSEAEKRREAGEAEEERREMSDESSKDRRSAVGGVTQRKFGCTGEGKVEL
jgi:hypothetical protein